MIDGLEALLPGPSQASDSWRWASVTQETPLRVRLDGESVALPVTPDALGGPYPVGRRVLVLLTGRRLLVMGAPLGSWRSWTPTVVASGTALNLGATGVRAGAFTVQDDGTVHWRATFEAAGAGVAAGSGNYSVAPPLQPAGGLSIVGTGWIYGAAGFATFIADGSIGRLVATQPASYITAAQGFTAPGHALSIAGTYQRA